MQRCLSCLSQVESFVVVVVVVVGGGVVVGRMHLHCYRLTMCPG